MARLAATTFLFVAAILFKVATTFLYERYLQKSDQKLGCTTQKAKYPPQILINWRARASALMLRIQRLADVHQGTFYITKILYTTVRAT